jgi:extracellular elastinolytic metalloproteinase
VASLLLVAVPTAGAGSPDRRGVSEDRRPAAGADFDIRPPAGEPVRPTAAQATLRRSLGRQGVLALDPRTGTPRVLARLDGFLTGPSRKDAREIVLDYVRARPGVFRLDDDDLAALRLARDYTDAAGVRHLLWAQTYGGIPAFDSDLRASVTSDGRLVNVMGSPEGDLRPTTTVPEVGAAAAVATALRSAGRAGREPRVVAAARGITRTTRFAGGHRAGLVLVNDGEDVRLAWRVTARADSDEVYASLVDASSGEVLRRANKVEDAEGKAWDNYPGAPAGGSQVVRDFTPWTSTTSRLEGNFAHVFSDLDDDNVPDANEEVSAIHWTNDFGFSTYQHANGFCAPSYPSICSWNSFTSGSWSTFRRQNTVQVFYFVNTFHDHLKNDPSIGFNAASGNFEDADKVIAHADDGANQAFSDFLALANMPDEAHLNNANMFTPPNGSSPTMQMYLFTAGGGSTIPDVNGGDDASIVYHEYTHGLSNRLITYADGWGALETPQSGALGEAWSDWYALDYLVGAGFEVDDPGDGDGLVGAYSTNGAGIRSEALDCPVGSSSPSCPGAGTAGSGGYTYGDFGKIFSGPEVHADGEIWGQTLWQLRQTVAVPDARFLVTEAMRLSPPNPSFLDMRNAIFQANQVNVAENGAADHESDLWALFAARGMGYFASSVFGYDGDVTPIEDFSLPPDPAQLGSITGLVRNKDTGNPVAGAYVALAGHDSGFLGDLTDVTDAAGRYTIANVPAATYPELYVFKAGWDEEVAGPVTVTASTTTGLSNLLLRRDWASSRAGGRIFSFTGPNNAPFCGTGPGGAIDQALSRGWPSDVPVSGTMPRIVVKLAAYADVTAFAIDPGPTCGDGPTAGLKRFRLEVSKSGTSWSPVMTGTFGLADQGHLNLVSPLVPTRKAVRYVRLTMLANHGDPDYVDMSELEIYGKPTPLCLGRPATRVGSNAAQTINGTRGADVIVGLGGNDRIDGRGGQDVICGGDGSDTLVGGGGVDKLDGGNQADRLYSRDGRREVTLRGGAGTDRARKDKSDRTSGVERFF